LKAFKSLFPFCAKSLGKNNPGKAFFSLKTSFALMQIYLKKE